MQQAVHMRRQMAASAAGSAPASLRTRGVHLARPACCTPRTSVLARSAATESKANSQGPLTREGSLIVTFDNTQSAEDALKWTMATLYHPGDHIDLVHVVCDPKGFRNPMSVGTTASGRTMTVDGMDMKMGMVKDYESRLKAAAAEAVEKRCLPTLSKATSHKVHLPRIESPRSASVIGDAVLKQTMKRGGRMLVCASHGPGALAEYGSVARYLFMHSQVPLVLVPPGTPTDPKEVGKEVVLVVARLEEVEQHWEWIADNLCHKGDVLHIWHAVSPSSGAGTSANSPTALINQLKGRGMADVQYKELYAPDAEAQETAAQIIEAVNTPAVKLVAVINYAARGMIMEAMRGSLASYLSRSCQKPLALLQPAE